MTGVARILSASYKVRVNNWTKIKGIIKKAPKTPGVYVFYAGREILYIGKASSLKNRLQSYLNPPPFDAHLRKSISAHHKERDSQSKRWGVKNARLQENATNLKLIPLRSEIEALIEEAKLIKKYNPPYNVVWRDDKTYFYAAFTKEKFPRIFVVHKNILNSKFYILHSDFIGPFTEGRSLRLVLKMLRRYFPYCTCPKPHLRTCLNAQIGNCFGFCCRAQRNCDAKLGQKNAESAIKQLRQYRKNISIIKNFLMGRPLKGFSKNLKPEEKTALEKILAHREFLENFGAEKVISNQSAVSSYLVECYDISHLSGKETVAGMTAWSFAGGELSPRKEHWRKFIIRTAKPSDDPAAMFEAVSRRLKHQEWPYPDLMIIDGGAGQFAAARKAWLESGTARGMKIISFAKPESMVYGLSGQAGLGENSGAKRNSSFGVGVKINDAPPDIQKIIPRTVAETHNFAVKFHRQRRKKSFLNYGNL